MIGLLYIIPTVCILSTYPVLGDYECVCNYNVEQSVLPSPDSSAQPVGYMYEFDCKPTAKQDGLDTNAWFVVAFEHTLGFVKKDDQIQQQICPGAPPVDDIITTTTTTPRPTTITTTPKPTTTTTTTTPKPTTTTTTPKPTTTSTTTTPKPTTTSTTTQKPTTTTTTPKPTTTSTTTTPKPTTTTTTPKPTTTSTTTTPKPTTTSTTTTPRPTTTTPKPTTPTTTADPIIGNIYLCPGKAQENAEINGTQLAQYETTCYELILSYNATWGMAEATCVKRGGHLADINDVAEQTFIERFLRNFSPKHAVWIGLNDRQKEGTFVWTSGAATSYVNWYTSHSNHFVSHDLEDCVVFIPYQNGRWDDLPCKEYYSKPVHYPTLCEYKIPQ